MKTKYESGRWERDVVDFIKEYLSYLKSRDVAVCRVKTDIFRWNAESITPKIIYGIEEVFDVMTPGAGELHQEGSYTFSMLFLQHSI